MLMVYLMFLRAKIEHFCHLSQQAALTIFLFGLSYLFVSEISLHPFSYLRCS